MHIELLITNIGLTLSSIISLGLAILVFVKRKRDVKGVSSYIVLCALTLVGFVWHIFYGLGLNTVDSVLSRYFLMVPILISIYLVLLNLHLVVAIAGKYDKHKYFLYAGYSITTILVIFYAIFPDLMMLPSAPVLYFPNFIVPGDLFWIQDNFFLVCFLYLMVVFFTVYRGADHLLRGRLKYFIVAYLFGYLLGLLPEFLIYGIAIDPLMSAFAGFYTIPLTYAILKYDVIELNILAKRALGYGLSIAGVTAFIVFIGYANEIVTASYPGFPNWILPLFSGIIAVAVGVFVWHKIKEVDALKYQFIDVVTHKFRAPMTYIRWSLDTLLTTKDEQERAQALAAIGEANARLVELTNYLTGLAQSDTSQYLYNYSKEKVSEIIKSLYMGIQSRITEKHITIDNTVSETLPEVLVDRHKINFVAQMIMENAITYSPENATIVVRAEQKKDFVYLSIKDQGIGIAKEDLSHLFSKFYRGTNAVRAHTEGLGIGLYLSRDIMKRHGGDIWAESEGAGKGSTFFVKIPIAKEEEGDSKK